MMNGRRSRMVINGMWVLVVCGDDGIARGWIRELELASQVARMAERAP